MTHPYFTIVGKCRNCGRPLVHGETRPYLHRAEDFAADKPIDCFKPEPITALEEVAQERRRQDEKWGEQNHPDGTGPALVCVPALVSRTGTYGGIREIAKAETDRHAEIDTVTFADILLEEVFEALAEEDPAKLRTELIQVAAVATQWVQKIDRDTARRSTSTP